MVRLGASACAHSSVGLRVPLPKLAVDSVPRQLDYFIPVWAVPDGTVFLDEQPEARHLLALGLILAGVLVSQFEYRSLRAGRRTREEARSVA